MYRRRGRSPGGSTLVLCLLAALSIALLAMGERPLTAEDVPVLYVADGDTVKVRYRGKEEWVRFLRIDTPERNEAGYAESKRALAAMTKGRTVSLIFEREGFPERDDYGRLLAYILIDGININVEMVRAGWSPFWTRYGEGRFAPEFRVAEEEARRDGRGLWKRRRRR